MRNIYVEILDVLETRREYLAQSEINHLEGTVQTRLDELRVVRAIINTLNEGDNEDGE